jgi:hypothetical protein
MSDTSKFGSSGTAVVEPPAEEAAAAETAGRARPKPLVLGGVVAGVLVLALAAYFLLFSGGGSDTAASGTVPKGVASAGTGVGTKAPSAAKPVVSKVPATVGSASARDPFAPLVVPTTASSATSTAASSAAGSGSSATTTTTSVPAGLVENVTLNKLGSSSVSADVTVNGVKYTGVKPGVVFAKYFSLDAAVVGSTATFHFGDSTFTLAVGKATTVRT